MMTGELETAIREHTDNGFEILGELAPDPRGGKVYLSRDIRNGTLAILSAWRTSDSRYSVEVNTELDDTLLTHGSLCVVCGTAAKNRAILCRVCHTRMEYDDVNPLPHLSGEDLARAVGEVAGVGFELLGTIGRMGHEEKLFFARELSTGCVVPLGLHGERDDEGQLCLAVGVTRLVKLPAPGAMAQRVAVSVPERAPFNGIIADRFRILAEISADELRRVFLANDTWTESRCTVTVLDPLLVKDPTVLERLLTDTGAAGGIRQENIAKILDRGTIAEGFYIASESIEGDSVAGILAGGALFPPERSISIGLQIADALVAAHAAGIFHRCLSPRDVVVARRPEGDQLQVTGFGIAGALLGGTDGAARGVAADILDFQSPEQLMGSADDARGDVYGLGCILFQMLTGQRVFDSLNGSLDFGRRMTEDAPRVRSLEPDVPVFLDELVATALSRDPSTRFQSALLIREALGRAADQLAGRGASAPESAAEGVVETRAADPAPTMDGGSGGPQLPRSNSRDGRAASAKPGQKYRWLLLAGGAAVVAGALVWFGMSSREVSLEGKLPPLASDLQSDALTFEPAVSPADGPPDDAALAAAAAAAAEAHSGDVSSPESADPAIFTIEGDLPRNAVIAVDNQPRTGRSLTLPPGPHFVSVLIPGEAVADTFFEASAGQLLIWTPALVDIATRQGTSGREIVGSVDLTRTSGANAVPSTGVTSVSGAAVGSGADAAVPAELRDILGRLAGAIESRNVEQIAAAYPGITEAERAAWSEFFANNASIRARVSGLSSVPGAGESSQVTFTMTIDFVNGNGSAESWVQRNSATLSRRAEEWRIETIREAP
ncbi:MAG: serine/threonine protein kinase [Gemmatimonadota bacterium]|jgi:hypothetical protein|nr:serine/threonine protein kinase [Gemmatimonadota bacterium]